MLVHNELQILVLLGLDEHHDSQLRHQNWGMGASVFVFRDL